jgi:hypothetical protein
MQKLTICALALLAICSCFLNSINAQNVGIGIAAPAQKLHVSDVGAPNSATVRVSGLASTSTLALGTAPFSTVMVDANGVMYRGGTVGAPPTAWLTRGNAGTNVATDFMGSTDNVDVAFRTNNTETFRMTNGQKLLVGVTTATAPSTQKMEVNAATGDALWAHSPNVGGWLGYETNFVVGSAGTIQGSGVWAANPTAGYTSSYAQSSGAATVAANINFSSVWISSYNIVDNASAGFNPPGLYGQLNVTNAANTGLFQIAAHGYSNRGTTAGNPGYTVGLRGTANAQNQDGIGLMGTSYTNSGFTIGGYFEGNSYANVNVAYAYVGGNDGFGATKITGTGAVAEIIPTPNHGRIKMLCPESPEYWYQDYGTVTLVNGFAHVDIDPILADIIVVDAANPIRVFATPVNMLNFEGVTMTNLTPTGFDLVELNGATHSGIVDYQLVCKPKTNFGQGRFIQARGPAWLKPEMEPVAAKAANRTPSSQMFQWPADHIQYGYDPEEVVGIGEIIPAGPNAGKFKLGGGKYSDHLPMDNRELK